MCKPDGSGCLEVRVQGLLGPAKQCPFRAFSPLASAGTWNWIVHAAVCWSNNWLRLRELGREKWGVKFSCRQSCVDVKYFFDPTEVSTMGCCIGAIELPRWETIRNETIQVLTLLGLASLTAIYNIGARLVLFCTRVEAVSKSCKLYQTISPSETSTEHVVFPHIDVWGFCF